LGLTGGLSTTAKVVIRGITGISGQARNVRDYFSAGSSASARSCGSIIVSGPWHEVAAIGKFPRHNNDSSSSGVSSSSLAA
jgi:hypothetical protein